MARFFAEFAAAVGTPAPKVPAEPRLGIKVAKGTVRARKGARIRLRVTAPEGARLVAQVLLGRLGFKPQVVRVHSGKNTIRLASVGKRGRYRIRLRAIAPVHSAVISRTLVIRG